MSDSEKWAWWALGVVFLTICAYGAFLIFLGHGPATTSVFALLALTAVPASSRRYFRGRTFDEREREIANKAWRAGFSAVWLAFIGLFMTIGFVKGWDATLYRAGLEPRGDCLVGRGYSPGCGVYDNAHSLPRWSPCLARNR
jgi:hypothetical protein